MFPTKFFNTRYWASRFWAKVGLTPVIVEPDDVTVMTPIDLKEVESVSFDLTETTHFNSLQLEESITCPPLSTL